MSSIQRRFRRLYGNSVDPLMDRFLMVMGRYGVGQKAKRVKDRWNERDAVLIAYPDMVREDNRTPLFSLRQFLHERLRGAFSTVHLLPFFPSSSDDGFSVVNYRTVEPEFGTWKDVESIGQDFHLMFDLVLNHCSRENSWFKDFIGGIEPARHYFLLIHPETDLSAVIRPRTNPLLTRAQTRDGEAHVWTTFSSDQVDLNWQNPEIFFEFMDILLFYLSKGARIIRLDAVAYLWKELGTDCLHRPESHEIVRLLREVIDLVAPERILLTETNVPQEENIAWLGEGDEAHMVYQFSLPPLLLHGLLRENAHPLTRWAAGLPELPKGSTFFNFTASHDGIGLRPLEGLLPKKEINWLVRRIRQKGGFVSKRTSAERKGSPYELNITYYQACSDSDNIDLGIERFFCSQAVSLSLKGIPGVYFNSLLAASNDEKGFKKSGRYRTLNRGKWEKGELDAFLDKPETVSATVFKRYVRLLKHRSQHPAFHPDANQEILDLGPELFGLVRKSPRHGETILCLFNFTPREKKIDPIEFYSPCGGLKTFREIISAKVLKPAETGMISLGAYQALWLQVR